jgi:hypothetical protein
MISSSPKIASTVAFGLARSRYANCCTAENPDLYVVAYETFVMFDPTRQPAGSANNHGPGLGEPSGRAIIIAAKRPRARRDVHRLRIKWARLINALDAPV